MARGMSDDYSHWKLGGDGRWMRHHLDDDGEPLPDLQADAHRDARAGGAARPAAGDAAGRRGAPAWRVDPGAPAPLPVAPRRRRASRSPWCTARATTTGPGPRASSTPARTGRWPPCARPQEETGWWCASGRRCLTRGIHRPRPRRQPDHKVVRYWAARVTGGDGPLAQRDRRGALARRRRGPRPARLGVADDRERPGREPALVRRRGRARAAGRGRGRSRGGSGVTTSSQATSSISCSRMPSPAITSAAQ